MSLSLQTPLLGGSNATEDAKVASDFTAIQTWANGNISDSDLHTPNNTVRRLLLTATGVVLGGGSAPSGDAIVAQDGSWLATSSSTQKAVPLWSADSGLSSQPQDFVVANLATKYRVRATVVCNGTSPAVTVTLGFYALTSVATGAVASEIIYHFGAAVAGSTVAATLTVPGAVGVESAEFTVPTSVGTYALGANFSGAAAVNSLMSITVQLYAYNS